ncbi:amino acid ABC transporter permease, partial [Providencia rettgeri]|nr:amino acid ABC transporter permease [Providencia rettgeri]
MSHTPTSTVSGPPPLQRGPLGWLRQNLFSSPLNAILTALSAWLLLMTVPAMIDWLFIKANFDAQTAQDCRASAGACWAFIREKHRLILFGIYPYDEQWRPLLASILLTLLIVCSCVRWFWKPWLPLLWLVGLAVVGILMWGGVLGLS